MNLFLRMLYFPVVAMLTVILVPLAWIIGAFLPDPECECDQHRAVGCEICGGNHLTSGHLWAKGCENRIVDWN